MRGEHDAGSFPLTGYPSMKEEDWIRIFEIGKAHGLNHWRFHSWCPPEACFEAADEMGIYLQPELSIFSQKWENSLVGTDSSRDAFLYSELKKTLDTYGNHPSFVFMCIGNEIKGDHTVLEDMVAWGKKYDSRHLYAGNANLEAMGKYHILEGDDFQVAHAGLYERKRVARRMAHSFNSEKPNTEKDYSNTLIPPFDQWPIISHEVGQWTVYPDFSEIEKYHGILAPRNLEVFQSRLKQKGMLNHAHDFMMATGKLSALLYREEMERLFRTPGMGGFQLLDLRDYPGQGSALVGMLNPFWESKGFITADEFRESCNDVTLLLKMPKRVWQNNEKFNAELIIPNYGATDLKNLELEWKVTELGKELFSGSVNNELALQGEVNSAGDISFSLKDFNKASKLTIHLSSPKLNIKNTYEIWVYPVKSENQNNTEIIIATEANPELLEKIKAGASVLLVPTGNYDAERMRFTTPFWSTILFSYQIKTMGILCDPEHPIFNDFPTDYYTNWQWWNLTHNANAVRLNHTDTNYKPVVQVIDHPVRNDKLGAVMETSIGKGRLLVSTLDILSDLDNRTVARQLKQSILKYMASDDFKPVEVKGIKEAFFDNADKEKLVYKRIVSSNENSNFPIMFALDNDEKTFWQSLNLTNDTITFEIVLGEERYITGCSFLTKDKGYEIGNFKIYISKEKNNKGEQIIFGNGRENHKFKAIEWDNGFTIQKGKVGRFISIEIEGNSEKPFRLNEVKWIFGD